MRIVIQRTKGASVTINGNITAEFSGLGYVILLGIEATDTLEDVEWLVRKVAALRVFDDENGVMNRSILDIAGEHDGADGNVMVISQFTLFASYKPVGHGEFGADMKVSLTNDGPVTIMMDTHNKE